MAIRREIRRWADDSWDDPFLHPLNIEVWRFKSIAKNCEKIIKDINEYMGKKGVGRLSPKDDPGYYKGIRKCLKNIQNYLLKMSVDMQRLYNFDLKGDYSSLDRNYKKMLSESGKQKISQQIQKLYNDIAKFYSDNVFGKKYPVDYWEIHPIVMDFHKMMFDIKNPRL